MYSNSKETTRLHQHICWKHNKNNKLFKTWVDQFLIFKASSLSSAAPARYASWHPKHLPPTRSKTWNPRGNNAEKSRLGTFKLSHLILLLQICFLRPTKNRFQGRKHGYFFTWNSMISVTFMGSNRGIVIPTSFPPRHLGGCLLIAFLLLTSLSMQIIPAWDLVVFYKW